MYRPKNGHFSGWSMHEHHEVAPPERLDSGFYPVGASYALLSSISVLMLPLWRLMNAENGYYLVLSARYISDTSFATIHQKLDVSPRYISDTLRLRLVRGGSTIHQIIDVSSRYIKHQTIHLYISDTSKVMYHHPSANVSS